MVAVLVAGVASNRLRPPVRTFTLAPDRAYLEVAARWPGGIVDVPRRESNWFYVQQIFHRQPLLGGPGVEGSLTRPAAHAAWCADNSLLVALETVAARGLPMPAWDRADLGRLGEAGFATIVLHRIIRDLHGPIVRSVGGEVYRDEGYSVISIEAALASAPTAPDPQ